MGIVIDVIIALFYRKLKCDISKAKRNRDCHSHQQDNPGYDFYTAGDLLTNIPII